MMCNQLTEVITKQLMAVVRVGTATWNIQTKAVFSKNIPAKAIFPPSVTERRGEPTAFFGAPPVGAPFSKVP